MPNQKARKQTKTRREKELCLDKCTHPNPRDVKSCWAQTRWHFQLMKGFDICSPVTLAAGMNSWPFPGGHRPTAASRWDWLLTSVQNSAALLQSWSRSPQGWSSGRALCGLCWGERGKNPSEQRRTLSKRKIHLQPCGARVEWGLKDTWNIIFCETWKPAKVCACRGDNSDKQDCHLSSGCFSRLALKCVSCLTPEVMEPMPLSAATKEDCGPKAGEMRTCMDTHTAAFQTLSSSHAATDSLQSFSVFFFVLT